MNIYDIWCDLKPGVSDAEFAESITSFLDTLRNAGQLSSYRLMRRKLGLGPSHLGEFHIQLEFVDLAALDTAFGQVSSRRNPIESAHFAVNAKATNLTFALYRDFPDDHRHYGDELF